LGGLEDVAKRVQPLLDEWRELAHRATELDRSRKGAESQIKALSAKLEKERGSQIAGYRPRELKPLLAERAALEKRFRIAAVATAVAETGERPVTRFPEMVIRRDLADLNLRIAQKELEVAAQVLVKYGDFASADDLSRVQRLQSQMSSIADERLRVAARLANLRAAMHESVVEEWQKGRTRLNFVDFVYFSLGVPTTVMFGDILPNHWLVRFVATLHIVMSLVVVAKFLNTLTVATTET
jgi:chaperonin cofactor prefoldin